MIKIRQILILLLSILTLLAEGSAFQNSDSNEGLAAEGELESSCYSEEQNPQGHLMMMNPEGQEGLIEGLLGLMEENTLTLSPFQEALRNNPQAERFVLNEEMEIHPSEEVQSTSKTRAENRFIKSELKKLTPSHDSMEEKVFGKVDHPLTPKVLSTILYLRAPLSFEQIRRFGRAHLGELYRLETLVAENGLANLREQFAPTAYSKGVEAEMAEFCATQCFQAQQSLKFFFDHKKYYLQRQEALKRHWEENNYRALFPGHRVAYKRMLASYEKIKFLGREAEMVFQDYLENIPANREAIDSRQEFLQRHIDALSRASDRERPFYEEYIVEEIERMRRESYHPFRFTPYQSAIFKTLQEAMSSLKMKTLDVALRSTTTDLRDAYGQRQVNRVAANTQLSNITKGFDEQMQQSRQGVADIKQLAKNSFLGEKEIRDKTEQALSHLKSIEALDLAIQPISTEQLMLEWATAILSTAEKTRGTFNMLKIVKGYKGPTTVSPAVAEYLGKLWVGPGSPDNNTSSSCSWVSQDGLKRYRFTAPKYRGEGSRADTGFQSNFDWRADTTVDWSLSPAELKRQNANWGDGHLDILLD